MRAEDNSSRSPSGNRYEALSRDIGDSAVAAGLCLLALLVIGGLLVLALRLRFPQLGGAMGASGAAGGVGIASMAVLGAPVHIGPATLWSLPMGALALFGLLVIRAGADLSKRRHAQDTSSRLVCVGQFAGLFAVSCLVVALGADVVSRRIGVSPIIAGLLGASWAALFGSLGALSKAEFSALTKRLLLGSLFAAPAAEATRAALFGGLGAASLLGGLMVLGRIAQGFFGGNSGGTGAAALVLLAIAFAPNIVITLACAGLGAPLHLGAGVRVGGHFVGPSAGLSIFGWTGHALPSWMLVFVVVPVVAGWLGARKLAKHPGDTPTMTGRAALTGIAFGVVMAIAALVAKAHLGLRIVHSAGFASIGPDPLLTLVFGSLLVGVIAGAGALAIHSRGGRR